MCIFQNRIHTIHNTIGSCVGNKIDINEGNLLVAYNMCYADACLQQNHHELEQFNKWHDYLFDAVIQGDPITYLYGTKDFNEFIFSNGGQDSTLRDQFVGKLYSWMALLVFHEVGHIVLGHASRWYKQYPNASLTKIASWTKDQYAYSRAMEIEADNKALDLYMNLMRYDPGSILSYVDWQFCALYQLKKRGMPFTRHIQQYESGYVISLPNTVKLRNWIWAQRCRWPWPILTSTIH